MKLVKKIGKWIYIKHRIDIIKEEVVAYRTLIKTDLYCIHECSKCDDRKDITDIVWLPIL